MLTLSITPPVAFITRQFGVFRSELANLEPLWAQFVPLLAQMEEERFDTAGFGEWPALAESTLKQKQHYGFPPDPLVRTGDLKDSLTDPERAAEITPNMLTYGTDVDYAIYHQEGTPRMPKRPVLELNLAQRRRLEMEMIAWVDAAAARAFAA